jgi:hypothetical protein
MVQGVRVEAKLFDFCVLDDDNARSNHYPECMVSKHGKEPGYWYRTQCCPGGKPTEASALLRCRLFGLSA